MRAITYLVLAAMLIGCASTDYYQRANEAAMADAVTTIVGLEMGKTETNPIVTPTVTGILAITAIKFAAVSWVKDSDMPKDQKEFTVRTMGSIWGGVAVNNLMIVLGASNPLALILGIIAGFCIYDAPLATP